MVDTMKTGARLLSVFAIGLALAGGDARAQTGDEDRLHRQAALDHATAIESAWESVAARIRVTDAGAGLWNTQWTGLAHPPASGWWLEEWTMRGLTARYCEAAPGAEPGVGTLAVYAAVDELKGIGRDYRSVQVAPTVSGGGRSGLHLITQGSRQYSGGRGRAGGALPACMPIPSTTGDRVGLVLTVRDPVRTRSGVRWDHEELDVPCPVATDTGSLKQRRLRPVQITAIESCGAVNCEDLAVQAGTPPAWPASCDVREAQLALVPPVLPGEARCTEWFRWSNDCQIVYDPAADPDPIPVPTIIYEDGGIYSWSRPCSCGSGMTGTCRLNYERDTEWRVFVLRPGEPEIRTWIPHRDHGDARFVGRVENCVPIQLPPPPVCTPPQVDDGHGGCVTPPQTPTSGTEACPAGFTGTATWTQQPGQARGLRLQRLYAGRQSDSDPDVRDGGVFVAVERHGELDTAAGRGSGLRLFVLLAERDAGLSRGADGDGELDTVLGAATGLRLHRVCGGSWGAGAVGYGGVSGSMERSRELDAAAGPVAHLRLQYVFPDWDRQLPARRGRAGDLVTGLRRLTGLELCGLCNGRPCVTGPGLSGPDGGCAVKRRLSFALQRVANLGADLGRPGGGPRRRQWLAGGVADIRDERQYRLQRLYAERDRILPCRGVERIRALDADLG